MTKPRTSTRFRKPAMILFIGVILSFGFYYKYQADINHLKAAFQKEKNAELNLVTADL